MIKTNNIRFLAASFLCLSLSILAAERHKLRSDLRLDGGNIIFSYENVSDNIVEVGKISFSDSVKSGTWLFLYDPKDKSNQAAYALVYRDRSGAEKNRPSVVLIPGQKYERTFKKSEVLEYFMYVPDCYYLTTVYRKEWGEWWFPLCHRSHFFFARKRKNRGRSDGRTGVRVIFLAASAL